MTKREKTEAVVLSRRNLGEADRLVTFLTENHGIIRVLAKGVRKVPSRRGCHLEPFTHVLLLITSNDRGYYLSGSETINHHQPLYSDPGALARIHIIAGSILGLLEEESKRETIYTAFKECLNLMPGYNQIKQSLMETATHLTILKSAGYYPQLNKCQICHGDTGNDTVILSKESGGINCLSCRKIPTEHSLSISSDGLKVLKYISIYPQKALKISIDVTIAQQLENSIRSYVDNFVNIQTGNASVRQMS